LVLFASLVARTALSQTADFTALCEAARFNLTQDYPYLANNSQLQCGAQYSPTTNYSLPIEVSLSVCLDQCPGWQISQVEDLPKWAGPLVGFLVPALVFVLSIPSKLRLPHKEKVFGIGFFGTVFWLTVTLATLAVELVVWIIVVFGLL